MEEVFVTGMSIVDYQNEDSEVVALVGTSTVAALGPNWEHDVLHGGKPNRKERRRRERELRRKK